VEGQSKVSPVEKEREKQARRSLQVRGRGVDRELDRALEAEHWLKSAAGSAVESAAADGGQQLRGNYVIFKATNLNLYEA